MLTLKTNLATYCHKSSIQSTILVMLTYAVWGLGCKMFTKLRFQSRSKIFWNRWSIKQYAITVRQARNQGGNLGHWPPGNFQNIA